MPPIKQLGAIMLAAIMNTIYREFIRSSFSGAKVVRGQLSGGGRDGEARFLS